MEALERALPLFSPSLPARFGRPPRPALDPPPTSNPAIPGSLGGIAALPTVHKRSLRARGRSQGGAARVEQPGWSRAGGSSSPVAVAPACVHTAVFCLGVLASRGSCRAGGLQSRAVTISAINKEYRKQPGQSRSWEGLSACRSPPEPQEGRALALGHWPGSRQRWEAIRRNETITASGSAMRVWLGLGGKYAMPKCRTA